MNVVEIADKVILFRAAAARIEIVDDIAAGREFEMVGAGAAMQDDAGSPARTKAKQTTRTLFQL